MNNYRNKTEFVLDLAAKIYSNSPFGNGIGDYQLANDAIRRANIFASAASDLLTNVITES